MAAIYARLVEKGVKTIGQVPKNLRDDVRALLGLDRQPEQA